jgi:hypothetical protein
MNNKQKRQPSSQNTAIKVALIAATATIVAAIIGALPLGINQQPLACSFTFTQGIYACNGNITINVTPPEVTPISSTPIIITEPPIQVTPFCAFLTTSQITSLQRVQSADVAIQQAKQFAGYRQNDYVVGAGIPANVVIATNIYTEDFEGVGVVPINNSGGYGLFLTTRELTATYPGTYWCIQTDTTPITPVPSQQATSTSSIASQLDALLGNDNWFCFPNSSRDIGINMPVNFVVQAPIRRVEHYFNYYNVGDTVPSTGAATAQLSSTISASECPNRQALNTWLEMQSTIELNRAYIDGLFGEGNWECGFSGNRVTSIFTPIAINGLELQYPFNSLDSQDIKYGVGDFVTTQSGTLWIALGITFPSTECP